MSDESARTKWFADAGFGMIAHWGVYSAIGRGEWVLNRERMPFEEYQAATPQLTGERFDADEWAQLAEQSEQKYLIFTAKHHDGFCLWDTKTTDWNSVQAGPKRDICGELIEAFHNRGLRIGFFFSMADYAHPDYPTPYATDWPEAWESDAKRQNVVAYVTEQVRELYTQYGPIDVFWPDGAAPGMIAEAWNAQEIFQIVRQSNPDALISNRLFLEGDFDALELHIDKPEGRLWETDWPLNDSWAWNPADQNYKSLQRLWERLLLCNGQNGNLILNVSPRPDGSIPEIEQDLLREMGQRLREVGAADFGPPLTGRLGWVQGGLVTGRGSSIYLHLWHRHGNELAYGGVRNNVLAASLIGPDRELDFTQDAGGRVRISGLGEAQNNPLGAIVRLDLDGPPEGFGQGHRDLNF